MCKTKNWSHFFWFNIEFISVYEFMNFYDYLPFTEIKLADSMTHTIRDTLQFVAVTCCDIVSYSVNYVL